MNRTQMIKRAYVRGLAARGIYRARLRQKQAAGGLKNYAISGGIGAAGGGALGSLIGALVQYARGKNVLQGALAGGGIGGGLGLLGGLGYQYSKKAPAISGGEQAGRALAKVVNTIRDPGVRNAIATGVGTQGGDPVFGLEGDINSSMGTTPESGESGQWIALGRKAKGLGNSVLKAMKDVNKKNQKAVNKLINLPSTLYGNVRNGVSGLFESKPLSGDEFEALWDAENGMSMSDSEFNDALNAQYNDAMSALSTSDDSMSDEEFNRRLNAQYNDAMSALSKKPSNGSKKKPKDIRRYGSNDSKETDQRGINEARKNNGGGYR